MFPRWMDAPEYGLSDLTHVSPEGAYFLLHGNCAVHSWLSYFPYLSGGKETQSQKFRSGFSHYWGPMTTTILCKVGGKVHKGTITLLHHSLWGENLVCRLGGKGGWELLFCNHLSFFYSSIFFYYVFSFFCPNTALKKPSKFVVKQDININRERNEGGK